MTRRRMDSDTKWRIMQHEALRTFARRHHMAILFGPFVARLVVLVLIVVGLMCLWLYVDHVKLGVGALIIAGVLGLGWLFLTGSTSGVQARMRARASGRSTRPGFGFGWAVAGVVVLLLGTGWLALWSPYA